MNDQHFCGQFAKLAKELPDLERLISRAHAGSLSQTNFLLVMKAFENIQKTLGDLADIAGDFTSAGIAELLRSAPDLSDVLDDLHSRFSAERGEKTVEILPVPGRDSECDEALAEVNRVDHQLETLKDRYRAQLKLK
jgi:DNA mismatch repair protein MSH6